MGFRGFAENERRLISIPEQFFRELLGEIDDLDELRLILNIFWRLQRQEGPFRAVRWKELIEDESLIKALGGKRKAVESALEEALGKAELRGSLLSIQVSTEGGAERLLLLNSPRGRAALKALQAGEWSPDDFERTGLALEHERPNIYRLYEENIGPLTPLIADTLRDAETTYPPEWIEEAISRAVQNNARSWRYIEAILRSWKEKGRDDTYRRDAEKTGRKGRKTRKSEFDDFIER